LSGKIADTFNEIVAANERMANQLARVGQVVGREGKTGNASGLRCSMVPGAKWRVRSIR
jgi:ribosomal protein S28E/S33